MIASHVFSGPETGRQLVTEGRPTRSALHDFRRFRARSRDFYRDIHSVTHFVLLILGPAIIIYLHCNPHLRLWQAAMTLGPIHVASIHFVRIAGSRDSRVSLPTSAYVHFVRAHITLR